MAVTIKRLTIEGFKSIRRLTDFELRGLNVLIGANGAGKSNFVSFFRFLGELIEQRLQTALAVGGGADAFLYLGPKETQSIEAKLNFGQNGYQFTLVPAHDGRLIFREESTISGGLLQSLGSGHAEAKFRDKMHETERPTPDFLRASRSPRTGHRGRQGLGVHNGALNLYDSMADWITYHFHDTSSTAAVRRPRAINDNEVLRQSAENLAPFLYLMEHDAPMHYSRIRNVVRLAAPFFDDFHLRPIPGNDEMIQLEWRQKDSDYPFRANQLSDGTLRFICLATALLQPNPPATMLFDEPELGLHPYALTLLGSLIRQAADRQIIVSTQSVPLLNEFAPEDVIIVDRFKGESIFRRLSKDELSEWLGEYGLGDLWQKNILGGRPSDERMPELVPKVGTGIL